MKINLKQLPAALKKKTAPLYLISGDEPLLTQEAKDSITSHAKGQGFSYRETISVDAAFSWESLNYTVDSNDLFSEKKILDIHNLQAKFDKSFLGFIARITSNPNPNLIIIITCCKLTSAKEKTKWYKAIDAIGCHIAIWPINNTEYASWIAQRAKKNKLNINQDGINLIALCTEGNLMAADQAITKLSLLFGAQAITADMVQQATHDCARFNVFDLANTALANQPTQFLKALNMHETAGTEPTLLLWALAREARTLHELVCSLAAGANPGALLRSQWKSRQSLLQGAMQRHTPETLERIIELCQHADLCIKGLNDNNIWRLLSQIGLGLCSTLSPRRDSAYV